MPSGSKKRKSSKKPKPQGDPPELEAGLEGAMANDGEVVEEATPSPKGCEGDPEAMAERGLEGNKVNGELPREEDVQPEPPKADSQTDEAAPDQGAGGQGDPPPSQGEMEPKIPAAVEAEAVIELEGENAQRETETQLDTPFMEPEENTAATPEEIKPSLESDAVPIESEPDAVPDTSPGLIKPDADIGMDEIESSKELSKPEREFEPDAAPFGSESGMDGSVVETETKTDAASEDIEPEMDKAPEELDSAAGPAEVELESGEPLVQEKPEVDAAPNSELEMDEAPAAVPVETDGAPDEIKPEEARVEEPEIAGPADIEPETEEALRDRELVTDAAPTDVETQVEELETAAPANIEPETDEALMERIVVTDAAPMDVEAEVEEGSAQREVALDATTADVELEMDAAPVDIKAELDTAHVETDASQDEVPLEIDAACPENETDADVAVRELESETDAAVTGLEPPTEVSLEPEVAPDKSEQDEVSQAEFEAAPEPEPDVQSLGKGESEINAEDVDNSAEIKAKTESPQVTEPELKTLDLAEDMSLEPPQEIEPELEVKAIDEAKPEDEVGTKADEQGSFGIESGQQDVVEGEVNAPLEINPEPEVETTRGIELETDAEIPLEAEPKSVVEAEPDGKDAIETELDQQDLVENERDQSGTKEHDQQPPMQKGEAEINELDSYVCEENQPLESQQPVAITPEVPALEDEPPAISTSDAANPMDGSSSSTSSSEPSDNIEKERTPIVQVPEEGDDVPPSVTTFEGKGESIVEVVAENWDIEQTGSTAVDNEQGAADELPTEAKEDISEERAIDVGHDEVGAVVASGNGVTEESSEQELTTPADAVDVEESINGAINEQERAADGGHAEDNAVFPLAGNGAEEEISGKQELGIEAPLADVVDVEELTEDGLPPSDQELVTKQSQPLIDEQDSSMGLGAAVDEPSSVESEKVLNATSPSFESEMTSDAPKSQGEVVTQANEGIVPSEHEFNPESATGERDIGEEEAASSTVAEVGSVLNDFDERAAYAQEELLTEFPSTEQDVDVPDCEELDDNLSGEAPKTVETGLQEQLDREAPSVEKVDANTLCGSQATSEQPEVLVESAGAAKPAEDLHSAPVEEMPSDDQMTFSPQPEQVAQDSRKDEVDASKEVMPNEEPSTSEEERAACEDSPQPELVAQDSRKDEVDASKEVMVANEEPSTAEEERAACEDSPQPELVAQDSRKDEVDASKEVMLANEEPSTAEEERAACEDDKVAANSVVGASFPNIVGDELISKAMTYLENGKLSSEASNQEPVKHRDESSVQQSKANNMGKAEIHFMDSKGLKEAEHNSMGGDTNNDADNASAESASLISEARDMKGVQVFRQESTQEASLPVVIPAQDRALERVDLKNTERPTGGPLQRRTKLLDCCGMFDLLLRKN